MGLKHVITLLNLDCMLLYGHPLTRGRLFDEVFCILYAAPDAEKLLELAKSVWDSYLGTFEVCPVKIFRHVACNQKCRAQHQSNPQHCRKEL